jgi:hypothetical protein
LWEDMRLLTWLIIISSGSNIAIIFGWAFNIFFLLSYIRIHKKLNKFLAFNGVFLRVSVFLRVTSRRSLEMIIKSLWEGTIFILSHK